MSEAGRHVTPLDLDVLEMGMAAPEERARLLQHLAACPACAAEHEERRAIGERFSAVVFGRTLPTVVQRVGARSALWPSLVGRWQWALGLALSATAAIAVFATRPALLGQPSVADSADIGVKGGPVLHAFAQAKADAGGGAGNVFPVADRTRLRAGDALRFTVDPAGMSYLMIASVDGRGHVGVYFPFQGDQSAPIDPARRFETPSSIVLDDAPGPERIFAIFSASPLAARDVRAALEGLAKQGPNALRTTTQVALDHVRQASLLIEKAP